MIQLSLPRKDWCCMNDGVMIQGMYKYTSGLTGHSTPSECPRSADMIKTRAYTDK